MLGTDFLSLKLFGILVVTSISFVIASNWAQVSGDITQTVTYAQVPTPFNPHWNGRYGHTTIIEPGSNQNTALPNYGKVWLAGGDCYSGAPKEESQGYLDPQGTRGYKNDVWYMTGTEWRVAGDHELRGRLYNRKIPKVESELTWVIKNFGKVPKPGITYDEFIVCEPYFDTPKYANMRKKQKCKVLKDTDTSTGYTQWSPRRSHASVWFQGYMWVFGGRAREFTRLSEDKSVGGIMTPRIKDVDVTEDEQVHSTAREAIVLKSDVWKSEDGETWILVSPGCHAPQKALIAQGNLRDGKFGTHEMKCTKDDDCYGAEACNEHGTCECLMWSPREQHAVVVYNDKMYLSGGYASALYSFRNNCGPYACGDTDASSTRYFLNDIWSSMDGNNWVLITAEAQFPGRGGHQMFFMPFKEKDLLWIMGGRGGDNSAKGDRDIYFNDVWVSPLDGEPTVWFDFSTYIITEFNMTQAVEIPWSARTGHTVTQLESSPGNRFDNIVILCGGYNADEGFLDDVWTWRPELYDSTTTGSGSSSVTTTIITSDIWRKDFSNKALFGFGADSSFEIQEGSPAADYISPESPVTQLQKYWVPDRIRTPGGEPLERRTYVSEQAAQQMNLAGVYTVQDLADADKYVILKLRGYDFPQVEQKDRLYIANICDMRELAIAVVKKCTGRPKADAYGSEYRFPRNQRPIFAGPNPQYTPHAWYGTNWSFFQNPTTDEVAMVDEWDGCTYLPAFALDGHLSPNVNGLGQVDQVASIRPPLKEIQELTCKQTPGPRAWHTALAYEERLYLFGGKTSETKFFGDTWYRDAVFPVARFTKKPKSYSPQQWFEFAANKPGCSFEMRVWDPENYKEIRPWVPIARRIPVGFLQWQLGGPGNGRYTVYVRAVDPAGNRDYKYTPGVNVYEWYYISPTPWTIILAVIGSFFGLVLIGYLEYRRRVKKAAMERYAMKRMRRKFKSMQRELDGRGVDWRTLYNESKNAEESKVKGSKGAKKKKRDNKKEARDNEKKKRDKEKEKIKKKLKASKDFKEKKKDKGSTGDGDKKGIDAEVDGGQEVVKHKEKGGKHVRGKTKHDADGPATQFDDLDEEEEVQVEKDSKPKKLKDYEKQGKKYKKEEQAAGLGGGAPKPSGAVEETGTKQRKTNKKLKEYEEKAGVGGPTNKKDA